MKISHSKDSWSASGIIRRDFRHSNDGPEEIPARGKRSKKKERKPRVGCAANNGGSHIYVWVRCLTQRHKFTRDETGWHAEKIPGEFLESFKKVCLGCNKRDVSRRSGGYKPLPEQIYDTYYDTDFRNYWWR